MRLDESLTLGEISTAKIKHYILEARISVSSLKKKKKRKGKNSSPKLQPSFLKIEVFLILVSVQDWESSFPVSL